MCVYVYFFNVSFPQRNQSLEMSKKCPCRFCQCRSSLSICVAQSSGPCVKPITSRDSCCVSARLRGSGQLRMCFYFILAESGVVERHLLGRAEHLNLAI